MPASIDSLQIEITSQANKADAAIDRLVSKLDKLSNSIGKIPSYSIETLANGVDKLGNAMKKIGEIDSRSFTRLVNNINKLSQIDIANINKASSSILRISNSLTEVSTKAEDTSGITTLASALGKLGGKNVTNAVTNIPLLAKEMNNLLNTLARSPQISRNVIDMTNALANLASKGRSIGTASRSVVNGLNNTHGSMAKTRISAHSLASAFGRLYANYFLIIRGAKAFVNSIKSTADYLEAFNYYNVAFGKIADEWDKDWEKYGYDNAEAYSNSFTERMNDSLSKMSGLEIVIDADGKGLLTSTNLKNLGLNIKDVTQYASQLASVTNSVGQTGEVSLAAAKSFTKLGADMSSLFNIDYSDAMANLQSGLIGQSRALYKYGIDITNATLQTYAFELGLSKSVSEMTQAEKMQLRMVAILDQSRVAWGDLANTINSPSNMLRQFGNNVKEIGMVLGQLFIPVMQRVMPVINGVAIAIKDMLVSFAEILGVELDLDAFGQGFSGMEEDAEDLSEGLDDVSDSANKALKSLGKFDELTNINSKVDPFSSANLIEAIDLTDEIIKASEEYEAKWQEAFDGMQSNAVLFANQIKEIFNPLKGLIENIKLGNWFEVGKDVSNIVSDIFDFFSDAISQVDWEEIGKNIGEFLDGIDWYKVFRSVGNFIVTMVKAATELFRGVFDANPIAGVIVTALSIAKFSGLGKVISDNITKAFGMESGRIVGKVASLFLTAWAGYNFGEKLAELIWPEAEKYTKLTFSEQIGLIFDSFSDGSWKGALWLMGKDIREFYFDIAEDIFDFFGKLASGAWDVFYESFIEPLFSFFQSLPLAMRDLELPDLSFPSPFVKFPGFSTGGFPEDGLFMANRDEIVGQFSNGQNAVANNYQIVEGISYGVEKAVSKVLEPYLSQIAQNTRETADKEYGISEERVFRATMNQANAFQKRTGRPAFG